MAWGRPVLGVVLASVGSCEPIAEPPPPSPRVVEHESVAVGIDGVEHPLERSGLPMIGLQRIDGWTPRPDARWPPLTSKDGSPRGLIWSSSIIAGPEHYWWLTPNGRAAQGRDLDPAHARLPLPRTDPEPDGKLLGIYGDLLVTAVGGSSETHVEIFAALDHDPDDRWPVVELEWTERAVNGELSVWNNGVGPALAGDEVVILGARSVTHASVLDGVAHTLPLDHEPQNLKVGDRRAAWIGRGEESAWFVALDDFERILRLPMHGDAHWAGASLLFWDGKRLLRWTETRTVELELPAEDPHWFGDGDRVWLFEPGLPLWLVEEHGFIELGLALDWPYAVAATGGVLIWEVPAADHMDVYSTQLGGGLGFDRGFFEPR